MMATHEREGGSMYPPAHDVSAVPAMVAPTWPLVERRSVRRRPNQCQGRALETIGHAVEYLIDSRMHEGETVTIASHREAVQILMGASRNVFAECAEVVPFGRRFGDWLDRWGHPKAHGKGKP
jgi:hypothetical protein